MYIVASIFVYSCESRQNTINYNEVLWYEYPAKYWNSQGLHLGNGYFGATFFGGQTSETFSLSEGSMWTGEPAMGRWEKAGVNPRALSSLPEILCPEGTEVPQIRLKTEIISLDDNRNIKINWN